MGLKLYKIISRPSKLFRQYVFHEIPDHDFLQKTLILGILFFGTPGNMSSKYVFHEENVFRFEKTRFFG